MLTIAIQQALHCLASSNLEYGMVQQIHSSTALPRFLPREVGQNTDLAAAGQSWREALEAGGRERAQSAATGNQGSNVTVGQMSQLSYTFNYGQVPMHCDVTHIRITTKQVGVFLLKKTKLRGRTPTETNHPSNKKPR